jgi:hypothetical protein
MEGDQMQTRTNHYGPPPEDGLRLRALRGRARGVFGALTSIAVLPPESETVDAEEGGDRRA